MGGGLGSRRVVLWVREVVGSPFGGMLLMIGKDDGGVESNCSWVFVTVSEEAMVQLRFWMFGWD